MSNSRLHVLIVGAGPGGLCLAQGLRRAGLNVSVFERDTGPIFRRQGYRIHIDERGLTGLRSCLPPHLYELFVATTSKPTHQITVVNRRFKQLRALTLQQKDSTTPVPFNASVDRLTLREILLAGLDEVVHYDKAFSHYERLANGNIQAFFADGTSVCGDVLVGADGINSRVRRQFLPEASIADTGVRCIYGKTLLTEATRPMVPDFLHEGFTMAVGFRFSMALGVVEFRQQPAAAAAEIVPDIQFHTSGDYLMWSLVAERKHMRISDEALMHMDGQALLQMVLQKTKGWHHDLRALLAASEVEEIFPITIRVSVPCEPWQSSAITLLGDAVHAMSPAGGSGANMALLDAQWLCQALTSEKPLLEAMHEYEARMLKEGFEAARFAAAGGIFSKKW